MTKSQIFPIFERFYAFSSDIVDWNVKNGKKVNKENLCCPVGFSEELISVFEVKRSQIDTENDKKSKVVLFSKFLCICCQSFDKLRGLECFKGSKRKRLVVQ